MKEPCLLCETPTHEAIILIGLAFKICDNCKYQYGEIPLATALEGLYLLARAKLLEQQGDKKEALKMALKAGRRIGKEPRAFAVLTLRQTEIKIQFLEGDEDVRKGNKT